MNPITKDTLVGTRVLCSDAGELKRGTLAAATTDRATVVCDGDDGWGRRLLLSSVYLDEPAPGTWAWACERVPQVDIRRAEFANGRFVSLVSGKMCWDDGSDFVPHHDDLNATDWETVT